VRYLSRITLNLYQTDPAQLATLFCDDHYRDHQLIWRFFGGDPKARRDFLYRREQDNGKLAFYVLSERLPASDDTLWRIESKSFEPKLKKGMSLSFCLRANPVVTRTDQRVRRHDVIMDWKKRTGYKTLPRSERPPLAQVVEDEGSKWLNQRASRMGFCVDRSAVRVDGYQTHTIAKANLPNKDSKRVKNHFSTLEFNGILQVTEPEAFLQSLYQGIGPAKAFGCGLMLVRRL